MAARGDAGTPAPLDTVVAIAHDGVRHLLVELARRPPTPGVLEHLRERVELQLRRGPLALREAVAHKVDDDLRARLDDGVAEGGALADRVVRGELDDGTAHHEVHEHLDRELRLAADVVQAAGPDAPILADSYGRARDAVVYGL